MYYYCCRGIVFQLNQVIRERFSVPGAVDSEGGTDGGGLWYRGGVYFHAWKECCEQIHEDRVLSETAIDKNFSYLSARNDELCRNVLLHNKIEYQLVVSFRVTGKT